MFLSYQSLNKIHQLIDTPALLIDAVQMEENLRSMQKTADKYGCRLRPHIKTHKSVLLADKQLKLGSSGITAAKIGEAEVMANAGITDIFIANQITHPLKIKRLFSLHKRAEIIIGLDNIKQIKLLEPVFSSASKPLKVRIEIDSGLHRCGLPVSSELLSLAKEAAGRSWLELEGIFTHAGQAYAASSLLEIEQAGSEEGRLMAEAAEFLRKNNMEVKTVSTGSSPTAAFSAQNPAVNEIRPGNYIFYDAMQTALGSAKPEQCALYVLASVTSQPAPDRIVIDAGIKALNLDKTKSGQEHGKVVNISGRLVRLSEEHGIIQLGKVRQIELGTPVLIIPNHACTVVNLFDHYYIINKENIELVPISARGKSQ